MSRLDSAEFSSNPSIDVSEDMEAAIRGTEKTPDIVLAEIARDTSAPALARANAMHMVAYSGFEGAEDLVRSLMNDADPEVRGAAAGLLISARGRQPFTPRGF